MNDPSKNSYGQILKSSSIVGGSQGATIFLGIIQTKVLAVLLGPAGIGLVALYQSTIGIANAFFGLGVKSSGVRQIAEATSTGDDQKISRTIVTLRRVSVALGILGTAVVFILREQISQMTFGTSDHSGAIGLLALTLFFTSVSGGQAALVQGMRRIADLAKLNILGALFGLIIGVPIIYYRGNAGIVSYLVAVSAAVMIASWWYARKIRVTKTVLTKNDMIHESKQLILLGIALMASSLMTMIVLYMVRVMVVRKFGLEEAGLYQAASQLSNVYIGFILGAMGMDFYPRLTAAAQDNFTCNRLINEQAEVGLLMAAPGLLATLTFAPLILTIFYSNKFSPAYDILQWQILGTFLRVVSWPLGFTLLAKARGKLYFMTELSANLVHIGFFWVGIHLFGLKGAGIAFFGLYIFYLGMMMAVVKRLTGFVWSINILHLATVIVPLAFATHMLHLFLPQLWAMAAGSLLTLIMGLYCLKRLHGLVGSPSLAAILAKFKQKLGWGRP